MTKTASTASGVAGNGAARKAADTPFAPFQFSEFPFDAVMASYQRNLATMAEVQKLVADHALTLAGRQAELTRAAYERAVGASKALLSGEVNDAAKAPVAKDAWDKTFADARDFAEESARSSVQVFDLVAKRMVENWDAFGRAVHKSADPA